MKKSKKQNRNNTITQKGYIKENVRQGYKT